MIGMNLKQLIEKAYYGDEVEFRINEVTYFMQGYEEKGKYSLSIDYWNSTDGSEPEHDYILSISCNSPSERMNYFEEAKIFDGKTIYEAEREIEVLYG